MPLPYKTAWITGAGSGLGRALALALARRGITIAASGRSREELGALASEAAAQGFNGRARILSTPLDVRDRVAVKAASEAVFRVFRGPPDLAVLAAGRFVPLRAAELDAGAFRDQVEADLMGAAHMLEALLPAYFAARRGHIAIVSSAAGYRGFSHGAAYGAVSAALINLSESLAYELAPAGVKLQLVIPDFTWRRAADTRMPLPLAAEKAAERMIEGLASNRFEIALPRRLTWRTKLLRLLPHRLYLAIARPRTPPRTRN